MRAPAPLRAGGLTIWPPVVLAPMAGITNAAYRRLCREYGAGLYVSEMITSRALVERDDETMRMVTFWADEQPRSIQLYGIDPGVVGKAVAMVLDEDLADHIDLNFGCPVPKVTRKGGGSALPYKRGLLRDILRAAVSAAGPIPVTMKMRKGISSDILTYLDAGRIAEDEGCSWVALHGRTAAQLYGGTADWTAIARLKESVAIPVLGNGDVWEAEDALRMMRETGCDGVVVGRGCLGRPWLFGDLAAAFDERAKPAPPGLADVARVLRRHGELLADLLGEDKGCRDLRKHMAWYFKGFAVGSELRQRFALVSTMAELDELIARLDLDQPYPEAMLGRPRGRTTTGERRVALPEGWLDDVDDCSIPADAEIGISGG